MKNKFSLVKGFNDNYTRAVVKRNGKVYVIKLKNTNK
jgi:ribosomal protein L36